MNAKGDGNFAANVFFLFHLGSLQSLDFDSILPDDADEYDSLQPPRTKGRHTVVKEIMITRYILTNFLYFLNDISAGSTGKPTIVRFHVTVLSIDTIDEGSMVSFI